MSTVTTALRPSPIPASTALRSDPVAQAFMLLRIAFTVAPIIFGIDKFAGVLTDDWTRYLAPAFNDIIPGNASDAMHIVGVRAGDLEVDVLVEQLEAFLAADLGPLRSEESADQLAPVVVGRHVEPPTARL